MPRAEAEALFNIIAAEGVFWPSSPAPGLIQIVFTARSIDPLIQIDAMGSYRRGEETCGDLDCLITRDPSDGKTHAGECHRGYRDDIGLTLAIRYRC